MAHFQKSMSVSICPTRLSICSTSSKDVIQLSGDPI